MSPTPMANLGPTLRNSSVEAVEFYLPGQQGLRRQCFGTCASRMALLSSCPRPHRDHTSRTTTFATSP